MASEVETVNYAAPQGGGYVDDTPPGWREALGTGGILKLALVVGLVIWLYWEQLVRFVLYWQQPDWSHGFLIPLFCIYLVHNRRRELLEGAHHGSVVGLMAVVGSIAVYFASIYLAIGYFQALSILGVIGGLVLAIRGWKSFYVTAFPIAFIFLAIPPPTRLYREFTQPMQKLAAMIASAVLSMFPGVLDIERSGGVDIKYFMESGAHGSFTVAGACSGMRSLMAFVALGLAAAYMTPRPTWHRILMALCVVPVALTCNILRVIITGSLQMYGYPELATGTPHTILGLVMFAVGFGVYSGILWVLDHLVVEADDEPATPSSVRAAGE